MATPRTPRSRRARGGSLDQPITATPEAPRRSPSDRADELDEMQILEKLRNEAGSGAYVRIYRRKADETEYSRLGRMDFDDYSEDKIEDIFGGGQYRVTVHSAKHTILKQFTFKVDSSIPSKHPKARDESAPSPTAGTDAVELLRTVLEDRAERGGGSGGGDGLTMKDLMLLQMSDQKANNTRFDKLVEAIGNRGNQQESPLMLMLMKSFIEQKATPMKEMMESFTMLRRFSGKVGGDDEPEKETFMDKALRIFGPVAGAMIAKMMDGEEGGALPPGAPMRRLPPGAPGPRTVKQAPSAGDAATVEEFPQDQTTPPPMNFIMRGALQNIAKEALAAAEAGDDPEAFALGSEAEGEEPETQGIIDMIPPAFESQALAALQADNWFEVLFAQDPAALKHKDWLGKVRDVLVKELSTPAE